MASQGDLEELKKLRSQAQANLTRKINKLQEAISNNDENKVIKQCLTQMREAFKLFQNAHQNYHDSLTDEGDIEVSNNKYCTLRNKVASVEKETLSWVSESEAQAVIPPDSISNAGSRSSSGSYRSTASMKARSEARKKALQAKAESLKGLHELQAEELRIKQKKAELELHSEIAAADAEMKVYEKELGIEPTNREEQASVICHLKPVSQIVSAQHKNMPGMPVIKERPLQYDYLPSTAHDPTDVGPGKDSPPTDLPSSATPKRGKGMNPNAEDYQPKNISQPFFQENIILKFIDAQDRQSQALQKLFQQQQEGVVALTLPQQGLQIYDGNPTRYHEWIRSFENLIETKTRNPGARLYYLVQYTSGNVKELMRSCLTMRDDLGYAEARRLLYERYGQSNRVATAIIQNIINGPPIKSEDADGLQQFSVQLTSGANTLGDIGHITKFDNPDNLRKIMERLTFRMRVQWRDEVDRIFQREGRDVNIQDISAFVTNKARVASHPIFGKISEPVKPTRSSAKPSNFRTNRASGYTIQVSNESKSDFTSESPKLRCHLCKSNHWLTRCDQFKKSSLAERMKIVRNNRLCMNCLRTGHFVSACPKDSFCKVEGCTSKHSTFLHPKSTQQPAQSTSNGAQTAVAIANQEPVLPVPDELPNQLSNSAANGFIDSSKSSSAIGLAVVPVKVRKP